MSNYELNEQPITKKSLSKKKIVGIVFVVLSSFVFIALFTNFLGFIKSFLLGTLGLFAYPSFIIILIIGIALINNQRYALSKSYIVYVALATVSLLAIIQLAVSHSFTGDFGGYLANAYNSKLTPGGIIIALIVAPFRYIIFEAGAFVVFIITLIVSIALIVDYFHYAKNVRQIKRPVKIYVDKKTKENNVIQEEKLDKKTQKRERERVALTLNAKQEQSAKARLGLLDKNALTKSDNIPDALPPIANRVRDGSTNVNKSMSIKEYLLSKPENYNTIFSSFSVPQQNNTPQSDSMSSINKAFDELKNDTQKITPNKVVHDEYPSSFFGYNNQPKAYAEPQIFEPEIDEDYVSQNNVPSLGNEKNPTLNNEGDAILNLENEVMKSLNSTNNIDINAPSLNTENFSRRRTSFSQISLDDKDSTISNENEVRAIKPISVKRNTNYIVPPIDLFKVDTVSPEELNRNIVEKRIQLEQALETFNVPAKVIAVVVGPAVTRYELEMPVGISLKKLLAHSDDIAYALASNGDIRIEAPIPGRSAVGIEVPNDQVATVGIREMLSSKEFQMAKSPLTVVLGKDISGAIRVCDLANTPHLLIAGSTNSGKSVCMNAIILSLLYRNSPDDLQLILVDPKRVEFTAYNGIPHLVMPEVITETEKAVNALSWAVNEMEIRFNKLQNANVKKISEYNAREEVKSGQEEKMKYIVIVVDELSDLMTIAKKEIEEKTLRLAQKARAAGIHMVFATQRPSIDVITGLIKANFPTRISFKLTSFIDSKTILDQGGAEKLLGKGDMLYKPTDSTMKRIQGCFTTNQEILDFVDYIKENNKDYDFDNKIEQSINAPKQTIVNEAVDGKYPDGLDELMPQALKLVIENGQASITILQRRLLIGYPRAARVIDQMEQMGYVSPSDGSKPRSVYITMEEWYNIYGGQD